MLEINKSNIFNEENKKLQPNYDIEKKSENYLRNIDVKIFNDKKQIEKKPKKEKASVQCVREVVLYSCLMIPVLIVCALFIYVCIILIVFYSRK